MVLVLVLVMVLVAMEVVLVVVCEIDWNGRRVVRWFCDWVGFDGVSRRFDWFIH